MCTAQYFYFSTVCVSGLRRIGGVSAAPSCSSGTRAVVRRSDRCGRISRFTVGTLRAQSRLSTVTNRLICAERRADEPDNVVQIQIHLVLLVRPSTSAWSACAHPHLWSSDPHVVGQSNLSKHLSTSVSRITRCFMDKMCSLSLLYSATPASLRACSSRAVFEFSSGVGPALWAPSRI